MSPLRPTTFMQLPLSGHTLKVSVEDGSIRVARTSEAVEHGVSLRPLPPAGSPPPPADNSLQARTRRSPAYTVDASSESVLNPSTLKDIFYALFSVRHDLENIRISLSDDPARELILLNGLGITSPLEPETSVILLREAFWQGALSPSFLRHIPSSNFPLTYVFTGSGLRHPLRQPKPSPGSPLYERWIPHLGQTFSLRVVDPLRDADVRTFNEWQNNSRVAVAWLETGTLEEHRAYLKRQTADPHQIPVFGALDGEVFLYSEIYWVAEDNIAPYLGTPHPYDRGFHVLVGSEQHRGAHRVQAWVSSIIHYLFLSDVRTQRVVMEPRLSNTKIIDYMCRAGGFVVTKHFDFPHKRSALLELSRERFFQLAPFHWEAAEK